MNLPKTCQRDRYPLLILVAAVVALCVGCSDDEDEDLANPDTDFGTVIVDASPDSIDAPWAVNGPGSVLILGSGDSTLVDKPIGQYQVQWSEGADFTAPPDESQVLDPGGTITFSGPYLADPDQTGTVIIDQTPDVLVGAGWVLTGPVAEIGAGDRTFADVPYGEYHVLWEDVDGFVTPDTVSRTLNPGEVLTFDGTYVAE